jgi:sugar lactone lactonase YvrE
MTAPPIDVELALDARAELGEGPVWDARSCCLYFVDILRGHVQRFDPGTREVRLFRADQPVGAVALTGTDDLLLAVRDGFARLDPASGRVSMIAVVEGDRPAGAGLRPGACDPGRERAAAGDLRMNDGACDRAGRFWAGTMALDERPGAGALYRLDRDGGVEMMLRPVSISNGIDWTGDDRRMYFIDSPTQSVDLFDFDATTGAIANRRTFVRIPPDAGVPDGLTVDADEGVWVALWRGSAVHRYTPDGALDRVVRLPVTHPTSCAFGGDGLRDLYITTASIALDAGERARQPHAGGLFRCRPGPAGREPYRFGR